MSNRRKAPEEKHKDKIEDLKAENRRLRKEVLQLRKVTARVSKREEEIQEVLDYVDSPEHEVVQQEVNSKIECSKCYSKKVKVTDLGIRILVICDECGHRKTLVK